jgi:hypothetical protein
MSPNIQLLALGAFAAVLIALAAWIAFRMIRNNPEKRERRRRLYVNQHGRLGDSLITEATDELLHSRYTIQGVDYSASQEIAALRDRLPADPHCLIGLANLKYTPKNPANSILLCEDWSGLRGSRQSQVS